MSAFGALQSELYNAAAVPAEAQAAKDQQSALHQALLDHIAQQDEQMWEHADARAEAESKVRIAEADQLARDRFNERIEKKYIEGDYFDPADIAESQKLGEPLPAQAPTVNDALVQQQTTDPVTGLPAQNRPRPLRFLGTPAERTADQTRDRILSQAKLQTDPRVRSAMEYEAITGKNPPTAMEQQFDEPVFRVSPLDKKRIEQFVGGQWVPYQGSSVPKGARILQETTPGVTFLPTGTYDQPTVTPTVRTPGGGPVAVRTPKPAPNLSKLNQEQRLAFANAMKIKTDQFKGLFGQDPTEENIAQMQQEAYADALKVGSGAVLDFNSLGDGK